MQRYLFVLILTAAFFASAAHAQSLSLQEVPEGVRLDVEDVPVEQALDALSRQFDFTVKIVRPSGAQVTGSRTGDAVEILNWVLNGHNRAIFVSKLGGQDKVTRVVVYGPSGNAPPPQPRQPAETGMDPEYPGEAPIEDIPPEQVPSEEEIRDPPLDGGVGHYDTEPLPDLPAQ